MHMFTTGRAAAYRNARRTLDQMHYRERTGRFRLWPDFIVIGCGKCGTTSLFRYLVQHPYVVEPTRKEIRFFDVNFANGTVWYRSHFPAVWQEAYWRVVHHKKLVCGEASPYYMFHPLAARRTYETIPQVKLIAMLRNPIDRAYSHYQQNVRKGRDQVTFTEAIEQEAERIEPELQKILQDETYYSFNHQHYSYLSRGVYSEQLKNWLQFFPNDQLLVLSSEDFFADTPAVFQRILAFLDLPPWNPPGGYPAFNTGKYPDLPRDVRSKLADYFAPFNQELYALLDHDFGWD